MAGVLGGDNLQSLLNDPNLSKGRMTFVDPNTKKVIKVRVGDKKPKSRFMAFFFRKKPNKTQAEDREQPAAVSGGRTDYAQAPFDYEEVTREKAPPPYGGDISSEDSFGEECVESWQKLRRKSSSHGYLNFAPSCPEPLYCTTRKRAPARMPDASDSETDD